MQTADNKLSPKVLFVITDSGIGGAEKVVDRLLNDNKKNFFQLCGVVVLKNKREMGQKWEGQGIPVWFLNLNRWPSPIHLLKLNKIIQTVKPDILHTFLFHSAQLGRIHHIFDRTYKLISSPRVNYSFASRWALTIDSLFKSIDDMVIFESYQNMQTFTSKFGYQKNKAEVVVNGVDTDAFVFDGNSREKLRKEWGVGQNELIVGSVGRLHSQKGFDILIDAVSKLRFNKFPIRLILVGEGNEYSKLKKQAQEQGVNLFLLGRRDDVKELLSSFDVYVQSSVYEGLSNALLEALSVGCSCVATAVDGTLDFAKDGENMLLVKPGDSLSLSIGIGHLLEKNELRKKLSKFARETALQYSLGRMVSEYESAYLKLMRN